MSSRVLRLISYSTHDMTIQYSLHSSMHRGRFNVGIIYNLSVQSSLEKLRATIN